MADGNQAAAAESATAEREIVIARVIDAPRALVFEVFTEVRHLSQWWGPDGTDYSEWIRWRQIVPPERIAMLHGESRDDPNAFETVLTFAPDGAGQQTLSNLAAYVAASRSAH